MNNAITTGWEVTNASVSSRNGGLLVQGINHETTDPLSRTFYWHVREESLADGRYDFSGCVFEEGAKARYDWLMGRAQTR